MPKITTNKKKLFSIKSSLLVRPVSILIVLILVAVFGSRVSISRIQKVQNNLNTAEADTISLRQKQDILREVQSQVGVYTDPVFAMLPDKNPALIVVSQLKGLAEENQVVLSNISVGSASRSKLGPMRVEISFVLNGSELSVTNFLTSVDGNISPYTKIQQVRISYLPGAARAEASIITFFNEFPQTLPAITDPIKNLNESDLDLISRIRTLRLPTFTVITASAPVVNDNPFAF